MIATTEFPLGVAPGDEMKSRSCDELREIASHGVAGGDLFFAASSEIERRAKAADDANHAREAETQSRRREIIWSLAALIGALAVLALARVFGL